MGILFTLLTFMSFNEKVPKPKMKTVAQIWNMSHIRRYYYTCGAGPTVSCDIRNCKQTVGEMLHFICITI